jgi:superfamily II DNA helicase RecQ
LQPASLAIGKLGLRDFKSQAQHLLVKHVLQHNESICGVLPTGAGKTLAIYVALTEEDEKLSIAIYPLRSVYDDMVRRLKDLCNTHASLKNTWKCWTPGIALSELLPATRLLLVSAETLKDPTFLQQLQANSSKIKRIIFDEAPVFVESDYRLGLSSIPVILRSQVSCPFVLLTATLQPAKERILCERFVSPGMRVIRAPTIRPEIVHQVKKLSKAFIQAQDVASHVDIMNGSLTIVFVKSIQELKSISKGLQEMNNLRDLVVIYHGGLNNAERLSAAQQWSSGLKPLMVATTAFAFGVHDDKCRRVIHVDAPFDIETYVQACGRSGRDGKSANSLILLGNRPAKMASDVEFFIDSDRCRLATLSSLLDTSDLQWSGTCGRCDTCAAKGRSQEPISETWRREACSTYTTLPATTLTAQKIYASKIISKTKLFIGKLLKMCENNTCFTCFVFSKGQIVQKHELLKCPHWIGRCFRCGSRSCGRKSCQHHAVLVDKLKKSNLCVTCSLPPQVYGTRIHVEQGSMGKYCKYRDSLLPVMVLMWNCRDTRNTIEAHTSRTFSTLNEYIAWALDDSYGLSRFTQFLLEYIIFKS